MLNAILLLPVVSFKTYSVFSVTFSDMCLWFCAEIWLKGTLACSVDDIRVDENKSGARPFVR